MHILEKLTIRNFKSIREQTLELQRLNVFIGGNGVGKSNLIGVFRFLHELVNQNLAGYTEMKGGADALLHFGRKHSPDMSFRLDFVDGDKMNGYHVMLRGTDDDRLMIWNEAALYQERGKYSKPYDYPIDSRGRESQLRRSSHRCAEQAAVMLDGYRVYHFHDTSDTAAVKRACDVEDNRFLRAQAENLPAFLYWMQQKRPDHFANVEDAVRQIAPFFGGFRLAPSRLNETKIRLEWQEQGNDAYFNATALSDGTLRFICLATLLLQPDLPALVLLDEPELGLHPAAIAMLADLLAASASRTQVIVATQSVTLVNHLLPEYLWTVEREGGQSVFRHLADQDVKQWLDDYSLGELWEKNVLGARP